MPLTDGGLCRHSDHVRLFHERRADVSIKYAAPDCGPIASIRHEPPAEALLWATESG